MAGLAQKLHSAATECVYWQTSEPAKPASGGEQTSHIALGTWWNICAVSNYTQNFTDVVPIQFYFR